MGQVRLTGGPRPAVEAGGDLVRALGSCSILARWRATASNATAVVEAQGLGALGSQVQACHLQPKVNLERDHLMSKVLE